MGGAISDHQMHPLRPSSDEARYLKHEIHLARGAISDHQTKHEIVPRRDLRLRERVVAKYLMREALRPHQRPS
jgi:hypothetical protein